MFDKNEVKITGTVSAEPKRMVTRNNQAGSYFSVCVKRPEPSRAVDYLYVTAWNDNALQVCEGYHLGDRISVYGRLQKQTFIGDDGQRHFNTRIIAEKVERPMEIDEEPDVE